MNHKWGSLRRRVLSTIKCSQMVHGTKTRILCKVISYPCSFDYFLQENQILRDSVAADIGDAHLRTPICKYVPPPGWMT